MLLIEIAIQNSPWYKGIQESFNLFEQSAKQGLFYPAEQVFLLAQSDQGYKDSLPNFINFMSNQQVQVIPHKAVKVQTTFNEISIRKVQSIIPHKDTDLKSFKESFSGILIPMDSPLEDIEELFNSGQSILMAPANLSWKEFLK